MPENFTKLEFATEGDIEWAFAALSNHAHDLARKQLAASHSRSAVDERRLLEVVDQWIDSTRSRLAPNVEVDGTPWRPGQQSEAEDAPTEPFDTDLQAQVAELTDRVEELTEAAVRGRKELPTARREAWEGREALRHRVQQALDKRAEQRSRRARKAMLKSAGKDPVTLPGLERRDEQSCTLAAALKDVEQLELSLPQQSMGARQAAELIQRLTASNSTALSGPDGSSTG